MVRFTSKIVVCANRHRPIVQDCWCRWRSHAIAQCISLKRLIWLGLPHWNYSIHPMNHGNSQYPDRRSRMMLKMNMNCVECGESCDTEHLLEWLLSHADYCRRCLDATKSNFSLRNPSFCRIICPINLKRNFFDLIFLRLLNADDTHRTGQLSTNIFSLHVYRYVIIMRMDAFNINATDRLHFWLELCDCGFGNGKIQTIVVTETVNSLRWNESSW